MMLDFWGKKKLQKIKQKKKKKKAAKFTGMSDLNMCGWDREKQEQENDTAKQWYQKKVLQSCARSTVKKIVKEPKLS